MPSYCKKIILTTDVDLIKDGVQSIPDDFLEWFVKNSSCEEVEVGKIKNYKGNYFDCFHTQGQCDCGLSTCKQMFFTYKIIIPKEEPKQETLEEAAERWVFDTNGHKWSNNDDTAGDNYNSFIKGAKWQQERMYNEEDMIIAVKYGYEFHQITKFPEKEFPDNCLVLFKQWLKTFKKK